MSKNHIFGTLAANVGSSLDNQEPHKELLSPVFRMGEHFSHAFGLHLKKKKLFGLKRIGINTKIRIYRSPNTYNKIAINFFFFLIEV